MPFYQFGTVQIFRPSIEVEHEIRQQARNHLFSRFPADKYRGAQSNAVVQHQFGFYERFLHSLMPQISSRDSAEFLLFQFDEAARILHGNGIIDLQEREAWAAVEPVFKRAIKYLIELMCMESHIARLTSHGERAVTAMEYALVCAESMADLAQQSELIHSVFPKERLVTVFDSGPLDFTIAVEGEHAHYDTVFWERVRRDRESRDRFVSFPQFDNHTPTHQRHLDDAFRQSFGMSYGEFIAAIVAVIDDCQPSLHPKAFPTLFVHRRKVIDQLAKSGRPRPAIERALDGFTVSASNLISERRVIWRPKQENRAYRRGFFLFPHKAGPHLAFSRAMARENLVQLVNWICYRRLPAEWQTAATNKALTTLSQEAGDWFEEVVSRNLASLGIVGGSVHKTVGSGPQRIRIPKAVGEIDFLGYQAEQKLLIVIESKMVMTGVEARYWRDDLHEFAFRSGSYAERFRRKIAWVSQNRRTIAETSGFGPVSQVGAAMLTLYPCIAEAVIADFPCVSITEFMLDYERQARWPYCAV